jgi:hypothetical protein
MNWGEIMSLTTTLSEIWRFIKDNKVKILIGAILISVLAVIGNGVLQRIGEQSPEQEQSTMSEVPSENLQESREYLTQIYEQEPATFEMFVQLEDGNVFSNSFIFDEYFSSPEVVEEVENQTGIEYSDTLEHEQNLGLYKSSQYRGSIAGIRNTSTNIITIRVQAGDTPEDNLTLISAFEDMLANNEVPFAEDLKITMIEDPAIGESVTEDDAEMVSSPATLGNFAPAESEGSSTLLYAIAGFIMGLLITILILFVIQLFKNKINYSFQYSWDFDDHHVLYSKKSLNNERLVELLLYPKHSNRIITHQESSFVNELINNNKELGYGNFASNLTLNADQLDEVIIFVESKLTDKKWYDEQYQIAELLDSQITVIQVLN